MQSLSAVMPSLNGLPILRGHLPAIIEELGGAELVVSDDGSTDGTLDEGPALFPGARFLDRRGRPRGFCHAVNDGVAATSGDLVLLINNDIVPRPGAFREMLRTLEGSPPDVWAVVPELLREGLGDEGVMHVRFRFGLASACLGGPGTEYPSGACTMFRRSAWDSLGGLDPRFAPAYWEDADLGARARGRGWRMARARGASVLHEHASTAGHSMRTNRLRERNRFIYMKLHCSGIRASVSTALWLPAHLVLAAIRGQFGFHLGLFDYLRWTLFQAREER